MTPTNPEPKQIICPECKGAGMIHIAATAENQRYDIVCPVCEGEKYLSIEEAPNE